MSKRGLTDFLRAWPAVNRKKKLAAILIILILQLGTGFFVYFTGGTRLVFTHSMYVPVIIAAVLFKTTGGLISGLVGGIILGPLMPLDVTTGQMQVTINWLYRAAFFTIVGTVVGSAFLALERINAALQRLNEELELRVRERTVQLECKVREMETFAYSVSHDLRAPLRGIDGYSRLLLEDHAEQLDTPGRTFLSNIRQSTAWMNRLIDDMLAYARLERHPWKKDKVSIRDVVAQLLGECQQEIQARGASVSVHVQNEELFIDAAALKMVVRNLLDNALKFTSKVKNPKIKIKVDETERAYIVSVEDNGVGFDKKYAEQVFEMFQRLHRLEDFPGSGVGLAMVRKAVERMGGKAWALSEPGLGATFFFEIPKQDG